MLWRGSGRCTIHHPLASHRFLAFDSFSLRPCSSQSFWVARRTSSSTSASAYLRQDASFPAPRQTTLENKDEEKLSESQQSTGEQVITSKTPIVTLETPRGLLPWLEEHFGSDPSRKRVCHLLIEKQDWFQFLNNAESVCRSAESLAQSNLPHNALYVLKAAHCIGVKLKQGSYEHIVYHLAMSGRWHLVLSVISAASGAMGTTTVRLLNWRARALAEVQNFAKLDRVLEEFASHGLSPQRRTFMIVFRGHLRNHDLARAKATIQCMEKAGFPVTASTYAAIIPAYRGFGLDSFVQERGLDVLNNDHTSKGKEKVLNGLLRLYLDKHDLEGALRLLEAFGSQSKNPDAENTSTNSDSNDYTTGVASAPVHRAILEDRATYTILIDYLAKYMGRVRTLNGIIKRMRACGITPDTKVGACVIRMFYLRGAEHKALVVLRDCCKGRELSVSTLKSLGFDPRYPGPSVLAPFIGEPSTELFNCVLHGAIHIRGLSATLSVLSLMKDASVRPNHRTLETFLWHLSRERLILTEDVVNAMRSLLSFEIRPTLMALNIIFWSVVHTAKLEKHKEGWNALAAYTRQSLNLLNAPESGHSARQEESESTPTFDPSLCMNDLQSAVFRDVLRPIIRSLHHRRVLADRATFSLRMRYDSFTLPPNKAPQAVAQSLQIMRDRGLHPNVYHYAALMEAHCSAGNLRAAHEVFRDAIARGLVPHRKSHVILYTILISANARLGRPDLALNVFKDMLNANVAPDIASVDALVASFFAVKAFRLARRVLLDLWPMVAPFPTEMCDASLGDLIARLRDIRDRSEAPLPEVKKSTAYNSKELTSLISEIITEWGKVLRPNEGSECDVLADSG